ncbi:MAG: hypothetical protein WC708_11260 [Lentisphaeria bacterium]
MNKVEGSSKKISGAFLSFRITPMQWLSEQRFNVLLRDLEKYHNAADELSFFSSFIHPVLPLETIRERMKIVGRRIAAVKAHGVRAGINVLATLGHLDEYLEEALQGKEYTRTTWPDGNSARGVFCPNCENFRDYIRQCYTAVAQAAPDFIWLDDDVKLDVGCFCDHCIDIFSHETGEKYTRESLSVAFNAGTASTQKALRLSWMEHVAKTMERLLQLIEKTVHAVNPNLPLGLMTGEHMTLSGRYDYHRYVAALSGIDKIPVRWRPGVGFYTDEIPEQLAVTKAMLIGRQVVQLPSSVVNIQSEIENFPYQPLKKSAHITVLETATYIAAGCTGAAYNVLGFCDEPLSDYDKLLLQLTKRRPFFDLLVRTLGRSVPRGVGIAWYPDLLASLNPISGKWPDNLWNSELIKAFGHINVTDNCLREIHQSGLPASYTSDAAEVWALPGAMIPSLDKAGIVQIFAGGVYLDGQALEQLNCLGYGHLTGFELKKWVNNDCAEILTDDSLNHSNAGRRRDCMQALLCNAPCAHLQPTGNDARILARKIGRLHDTPEFPIMGIFENELGGRVAIAGYAPWNYLQTEPKIRQLKALFRWLSRDSLSAYIASFHKINLWSRKTVDGGEAAVLLNGSFDPAEEVVLMLNTTADKITIYDMNCREQKITATRHDGKYSQFILPVIVPWQMVFVVANK